MARTSPFDEYTERYDEWFEKHPFVYESELEAVGAMLPDSGSGVEIGVGTGRFAAPLGIACGVEPSARMRTIARARGVEVKAGAAEQLPYDDERFDYAVMVTTVCFLDDITGAFREVRRILKPGGRFIVGFVDRNSRLGRLYEKKKRDNPFYREATFYSAEEVIRHLEETGFGNFMFRQTIGKEPVMIKEREPVIDGYGTHAFVVVGGEKEE
ncbi:MAG: methyltransferase domain-containing protein [Spirochaetales bacterium]|nr:methyltransferase domain-containing protein [Spirochaetales bacterium]